MSLDSLPEDVLNHIVSLVDAGLRVRTWGHLQLTCKALHEALSRHPVKNVVVEAVYDASALPSEIQSLKMERWFGRDLVPFAHLTALTSLHAVSCHRIEALNGASALTALRELVLDRLEDDGFNEFPDLADLAALTRLTRLQVGNADVFNLYCRPARNVSALSSLTALETLRLHQGDFLGLPRMLPALSRLRDAGVRVLRGADADALAGMTGLERLTIDAIGRTEEDDVEVDYESLAGHERLRELGVCVAGKDVNREALAGLTWLEALDLSATDVTELSELSTLVRLTSLRLSSWDTLGSIAGALTGLKTLALGSSSSLADASPLGSLERLEDLRMHVCFEVPDLSCLSRLTRLTSLWLEEVHATESVPFTALTRLRDLLIEAPDDDAFAIDLSRATGLTRLQLWDFAATGSVRIPPSVKEATFVRCSADAIRGLPELPGIERLKLELCTAMAAFPALPRLASLTQLSIESVAELCDLSPLSVLSRLRVLRLDSLPECRDLSAVGRLRELREFKIHEVGADRLPNMSALDRLRVVDVSENEGLKDATGITALTRLTLLDVRDCPELDLAFLVGMEGPMDIILDGRRQNVEVNSDWLSEDWEDGEGWEEDEGGDEPEEEEDGDDD